jgi:hypothetical protein
MRYSLGREPWWNAVKRARSKRARAASQDAAVATQRLPAFRFLHFLSSSDELGTVKPILRTTKPA